MSTKLKTRNCVVCRNEFQTYVEKQESCSRKCAGIHKRNSTRVACHCLTCKKEFHITPSDKEEGRGLYCSRKCSQDRSPAFDEEEALTLWSTGISARQVAITLGNIDEETVRRWLRNRGLYEPRHVSGDNQHKWNGGVSGHREIGLEAHGAMCYRCGYDKYEAVLDVHHKDRNRKNGAPSNLAVVCPTCHREIHYEENHPDQIR